LADVKTREVEKKRRSGGKLKDVAEAVKVSDAKPHMFRHTLAGCGKTLREASKTCDSGNVLSV